MAMVVGASVWFTLDSPFNDKNKNKNSLELSGINQIKNKNK